MESDEELLERIVDMHNDTEDYVKRQYMIGRSTYTYGDALNDMFKRKLYDGDPSRDDLGLVLRSYMNMKHRRILGKFISFKESAAEMIKVKKNNVFSK